MKRLTREKTKEITRTVLEIVAMAGFTTLVGMLSQGRHANKLFRGLVHFSAGRIRATLRRLKIQGMIEYDQEDEHAPIVLTAKGMKRVREQRFYDIFLQKRKWDHCWRMILFDIPERTGKRRTFQYALQRAGFYPLQKSVYVSPYDIKEEIYEYARFHGVASRVVVATIASLGSSEREARNFFLTHRRIDKTVADRQRSY